eukprot:TRINITY_DN45418_c0_g1_i1.p1 TRINITY_DN45418_c0_g1~~TRINITY_DN45418_c0_g1_i1.p1  ORF type:complete len:547 (-),score=63.00 TRINITY_DN45418_c0_g1_i1:170-1810(-)
MSDDIPGIWQLAVQYPNRDPVHKDVPAPVSLDDLRASLGVESDQLLLTPFHGGNDMFTVERLDQLHSGATLRVHIPKRCIYISVPPHIRKKAVTWYAGATTDQLERSIAKAAGFSPGTPIELRDGEATVVLSTTIPNDTHLEVVAYTMEPVMREQPAPSGRGGRASPGPAASKAKAAPAKVAEARGGKMLQSPSNNSVGSGTLTGGYRRDRERLDRSPSRQMSPSRARAVVPNSVDGSTTPAVHQSAPEEHCVHILAGHTGSVLCLSGVGDVLFTGSQDGSIMIWDLNNLQYIGTLPGHRGFVKCLCSNYAKKVLVSGSQDRTIKVWSLESFSAQKTLYGHTGGVNAVLVLEGTDVIVSASEDRSVRVWDLATYEPVACLEQAHLGGVFALDKFGTPGMPLQIVSGARDRSLKVWDSTTWTVTKTLHPPHYDGVSSIAVAQKHGKFYSASRDRSIKEWDVGSLTNTMHTLHVHGDWVQALCMSASDDILFSGSRDSTVKVWDGALQCQDVLQGHRGPVSALTTVGNRLFSASHDRTVRVWRIEQYG